VLRDVYADAMQEKLVPASDRTAADLSGVRGQRSAASVPVDAAQDPRAIDLYAARKGDLSHPRFRRSTRHAGMGVT